MTCKLTWCRWLLCNFFFLAIIYFFVDNIERSYVNNYKVFPVEGTIISINQTLLSCGSTQVDIWIQFQHETSIIDAPVRSYRTKDPPQLKVGDNFTAWGLTYQQELIGFYHFEPVFKPRILSTFIVILWVSISLCAGIARHKKENSVPQDVESAELLLKKLDLDSSSTESSLNGAGELSIDSSSTKTSSSQ